MNTPRRQFLVALAAGLTAHVSSASVPRIPGRGKTAVQASSSRTTAQNAATAHALAEMNARGGIRLSEYPLEVRALLGTGSMRPALGDGDVVLLEHAPYESLRIGDVVTWLDAAHTRWDSTGKRVSEGALHRIWGGKPGGWIMRGDNNVVADPYPLTPARYLARLLIVLHSAKHDSP